MFSFEQFDIDGHSRYKSRGADGSPSSATVRIHNAATMRAQSNADRTASRVDVQPNSHQQGYSRASD